MNLFRSLVFSAIFAGGLVGVLASAMHLAVTVPLILQAETFEKLESAGNVPAHEHSGAQVHSHEPVKAAESGEIEFGRNAFTVIAMILAYIGFALLLNVSAEMTGGFGDVKAGSGWGVAGFLVFSLVPALGLPPELPGMPAADLFSRQAWWIATVACTAGSLWLASSTKFGWRWPIAAIVVTLPFGYGAPHPLDSISEVPASLHFQFVVSTLLVSFVSWQILGVSLGWLRSRSWNDTAGREDASARRTTAR